MPRTLLPMLLGDEEERRYFSLFHSRTAPVFAGYYDASFWDRFILQISQAEPAVHHAVVALASLHETFHCSTEYTPASDQYGLRQYNKSLAGLNRYMSTAKGKSIDIVLICCILFTAFESLRGDYTTAGQHLQSGLKILSSSRQELLSSEFHDDIVPVFVRLRVQAKSIIDTELTLDDPSTTRAVSVPKRFLRLGEARTTCFRLLSLVFDLCQGQVQALEKDHLHCQKQKERRAHYKSLLDQWQVGFDDFLSQSSTSMDSRDFSGATLLKIHHVTAALILEASSTILQCNFDRLLPQFQQIVSLAKSLIKATEATGVSPRTPLLWVDIGIIAPLFLVATRCRDPLLRREAVRLISVPRREGSWDAQAAATMAERVIAIEEEGLPHVNVAQDVPESSRIYALRPSKIDLVTHQVKSLFLQNATKVGDYTCTPEETLTWDDAPCP